jgi:hypothetical protein
MTKECKLWSVWELVHGHGKTSLEKQLQIASMQFSHFCCWIQETMCGGSAQSVIIQQHQEFGLKTLSTDDLKVVDRLREIHFSPWTVPRSEFDSLVATFWALWHACEDNALADFSKTMDTNIFEMPLKHLCAYKRLLEETKWENMIVVVSALQSLLQSQLKIIIKQHQEWSFAHWYTKTRPRKMGETIM